MITDESNPGVDKCEARNYESPLHQREREGEREKERERERDREIERGRERDLSQSFVRVPARSR